MSWLSTSTCRRVAAQADGHLEAALSGWKYQIDLEEGIASTYQWFLADQDRV